MPLRSQFIPEHQPYATDRRRFSIATWIDVLSATGEHRFVNDKRLDVMDECGEIVCGCGWLRIIGDGPALNVLPSVKIGS